MTVYVDNMLRSARVGRIQSRWSHLFADTTEELIAFAEFLGLRAEWIQHAGTHREHFDLTEPKRLQAVGSGAVEITYPHGAALVMNRKRREQAAAPVCEHACQYAMDVGVPEYSGMSNKPNGCGNCAHYAEAP